MKKSLLKLQGVGWLMMLILTACGGGGGGSEPTPTGASLTSIVVTPANPSIAKNTNQQFTATGTYSDGTSQDITASVIWTSNATTIATVNTAGLASGLDIGTAAITAASGIISGITTLTVTTASLPTYDPSTSGNTEYKQKMRAFVQAISAYGRGTKPGFIVIPQNGHELVTEDGTPTGAPATTYLNAIDGVGREDLFYGFANDDEPTDPATRVKIIQYMDIAKAKNIIPLVTDYCSTKANVDDSYAKNTAKGYVAFAADSRELDRIPLYPAPTAPTGVNTNNITTLAEAKNFLYLLNSNVNYTTKTDFLTALRATNYDAFIIDLFFDDNDLGQVAYTKAEIDSLKSKPGGGSRLVIAYMSIGEAEDYRFYWNSAWVSSPPSWLKGENPDWLGNYKVQYWDPAFQAIIYGNESSYLKKILDAGFDGVYLDIIDAFEYFEDN